MATTKEKGTKPAVLKRAQVRAMLLELGDAVAQAAVAQAKPGPARTKGSSVTTLEIPLCLSVEPPSYCKRPPNPPKAIKIQIKVVPGPRISGRGGKDPVI
jgi:hypothetical protein